ncbi:hypothetical protein KEM48_009939 [Puccinia striiformis f. sp. tritici PST-130]|nr:hypothetical protein KEM48_009939 [Puccinia striiformis f. sp. tritici PST-130]
MSNVEITNITSMFVEREQYDTQTQESDRHEKCEQRRKIKLAMLMQQLEFLFYALVVLCYTLDGKNLIFILRAVSEVQFSQPKQIQPDRPLRFFALASFAICFCALFSHLSILSSSSYNPSGILVDFIGQFTWNHPIAIVAFLVGLDVCSCLVQLLLVLISFTQSHSIPISDHTTATHSYNPSIASSDHDDDIEANQTPSKRNAVNQPLDLRNIKEDTSSESGVDKRRNHTRIKDESDDSEEDLFLFDLTIPQVKALLFSTDPPTSDNTSATVSLSATPTSTPRPSRALESVQARAIPTGSRETTDGSHHLPEGQDQSHVTHSPQQSFIATSLPSRTVIIPIV